MTIFPIKFTHDGVDYTANVQKIGAGPVQYHVFEVEPFVPIDTLRFICNYPSKTLSFGFDHALNKIEYAVCEAVTDEIKKLGWSLCDY